MTTLTWSTSFSASVVFDGEIIPNRFTISANLQPNSRVRHEQAVALERIQMFCDTICHNSIFINIDNPLIEMCLENFDSKVFFIPEEPYDQILSMLLHSKLSAVLEDKFFINSIVLSSEHGLNLEYEFNLADSEYPSIITSKIIKDVLPWWSRPDMTFMDIILSDKDGQLSLEQQELEWHHVGLDWKQSQNPETDAEVIKLTSFKPTVLDGNETK